MSLDELEQSDIDLLVELLLRSQKSRERIALCINIGINHNLLNFIENTSEQDFFIRLINYLYETGNEDALCKVCSKELLPIFRDIKNTENINKIQTKLRCNQSNFIREDPITSVPKTRFSIVLSTLFVIVLTAIGILSYKYIIHQTITDNQPNLKCADIISNPSQNPSSTQIQILEPLKNTCVYQQTNVEGKVTYQEAKGEKVWIVVYAMLNNTYYVQPSTYIDSDGTFQGMAHIGDEKTPPNSLFKIRAVVKSNEVLYEKQTLDHWPKAKWSSEIISVYRKNPK